MKGLILFFFTTSLFAASAMKFDLDIKYNNKKITKQTIAQITANLTEEFSVETNGLKTSILASKLKDKNTYVLEAKVYEQTKSGNKLVGTPKIISKYGEETTISVERDNGEYVELTIKLTNI